jgi:hypothetical protein
MNQIISYAKRYGIVVVVTVLATLALDKRGHIPAAIKF